MPKHEMSGFEWGCDACSKKAMVAGGEVPDGWAEGVVTMEVVKGQPTQINFVVCSTPHIHKAITDEVAKMKAAS